MQVLVCVLNKVSALEDIFKNLSDHNLHGATVLSSKGMAHILAESEDIRFMESLIMLLNPENSESKTFFMVICDERVDEAISVIDESVGGINNPDTGVIFTLPVLRMEGFGKENCAGSKDS